MGTPMSSDEEAVYTCYRDNRGCDIYEPIRANGPGSYQEPVSEQTPFGECGCGSTSCGVLSSEHECWCFRCNPGAWWMVTCARCGDKRCPGAVSHTEPCKYAG